MVSPYFLPLPLRIYPSASFCPTRATQEAAILARALAENCLYTQEAPET